MLPGISSIWHWLIVLAVILLIFGGGGKISKIMGHFVIGKRLRVMGWLATAVMAAAVAAMLWTL